MRNTNALEEVVLTDTSTEPEPQADIAETPTSPEPAAGEPETQSQEETALVPTEPDVIEGEFVELEPQVSPKPYTPPTQKPYWLLIPFAVFLCLSFLAVSLVLPLFTPSATITIIPVERTITTTAAIQIPGRALPPLTLSQSTTASATGKRHQTATRAIGTITFYNGLLSSQTIAAGTVLTGRDGGEIITDQPAIIPAGNPPMYGQATVSAHAIIEGLLGNIPAYDINTACCATSVVAKNTQGFTGGVSARDYLVVTRADINTAVTSQLLLLSRSEDAALQAQLHEGEALIPPSCNPHVFTNHTIGDEAKHVSITVSETCTAIAYDAHGVYAHATQLLPSQAETTFGAHYALTGDMQVSIIHAKVIHPSQGVVSVLVHVTGTWGYQITPDTQQRLIHLIAGTSKVSALHTLVAMPGIQGAAITIKGNGETLPDDPGNITVTVVYRM